MCNQSVNGFEGAVTTYVPFIYKAHWNEVLKWKNNAL